jgi:hypothetical protein
MAFANTIGGASTGASLGSAFGPWGTAIGAGVGGSLGGLEDLFGGGGNKQLGTLRPNQQNLQDSLINLIQQRLSGQGGLSPISQNAMNRFNTQTVPSLAERFTSLGSGSQGSSAFAGQLGAAGGNLQNELAGLDWQQILQLLGPALGQSSENIMQEPGGFGTSSTQAIPDILKYLAANQGQQSFGSPSSSSLSQFNPANIKPANYMQSIRNSPNVLNPALQRLGGVA